MAVVKPLRLKQERIARTSVRALSLPFSRILVDHQIPHLEQIFDYAVPEELSERAQIGSLVEVEFGHSLAQGILLERLTLPVKAGEVKSIRKVLSTNPYLLQGELNLVIGAAEIYGAKAWDFIRSCIPPYSKVGEREFLGRATASTVPSEPLGTLPLSLSEFLRRPERITCALELPIATPYWELIAEITLERLRHGKVLLLLANEREAALLEREFSRRGQECVSVLSSQGKAERYRNFLEARSPQSKVILGLRSSALQGSSNASTIILLDDVDESHYERGAPSWNTRSLVGLRESSQSVIYASTSISLEVAERVSAKELPFYRFPTPPLPRYHSATTSEKGGYFPYIRAGLKKGSVLISVGATGYITTFSCQKCRNVALCSCGGKLYYPARSTHPICSTCATEYIEWSCTWCHESKPRIIGSGVLRRAEEFGRAFPGHSVIHSSAQHPVPYLPDGHHIVLSTTGVEPRGRYATEIFLDLEPRLLRTTLRTTEEIRFQLQRTFSMLIPGGDIYLDLPPSDAFLQSILRNNPLLAAEREIAERGAAQLIPVFANILLIGEPLESVQKIADALPGVNLVGPFLRNGKKSALLKAPKEREVEVINLLQGLNRLQSMRKEGLLTYLINPYSLN